MSLDYEQYVFFCDCGRELRTKKDKTVECICGKKFEVEKIPHKYLFPERKGNKDAIQNGPK